MTAMAKCSGIKEDAVAVANGYPTHSMMMPLPLLFAVAVDAPQCEHPPLDTTQPIHDDKIKKMPLSLPSFSVNEP